MIEYKTNADGSVVTAVVSGDMTQVCAELGGLIRAVYNGCLAAAPESGEIFRSMMTAVIGLPDSPVWDKAGYQGVAIVAPVGADGKEAAE